MKFVCCWDVLTLWEMRSLIPDGVRGLTPPVYPFKIVSRKNIKAPMRSTETARAELVSFHSSADPHDLCSTCNQPPKYSPQGTDSPPPTHTLPPAGRCSARKYSLKHGGRGGSDEEQQLCASVVHDRWNQSRRSSKAPRHHGTYCTTGVGEIKWQGHTDVQTVGTRNTKAHMDLKSPQVLTGTLI